MFKLLFIIALSCLCSAAYAAEGKADGGYVPLDQLVVNLKDSGYISFTSQLKLASPEDREYVKAYIPVVRHELIKLMMGREAMEVQTPAFISGFAQSALDIANKVVGSGYVKGVFLTDWIVQ